VNKQKVIGAVLELVLVSTIGVGLWLWAGLGPALVVFGALGLVLVELYGLGAEEPGVPESEGISK
jgi:hypothetical protein